MRTASGVGGSGRNWVIIGSGSDRVIKHREFDGLDRAHNARLNDDVYHRRSVVESVFATLKQRYGDRVRARSWYGQFRELAIKSAVKNLASAIGTSHD